MFLTITTKRFVNLSIISKETTFAKSFFTLSKFLDAFFIISNTGSKPPMEN